MGAQEIMLELESIVEACDGIRYYIEQADGDEDEAWEFRNRAVSRKPHGLLIPGHLSSPNCADFLSLISSLRA